MSASLSGDRYEPLLKSVDKTAATEEASLFGGGIEAELLAHMTTPEGLAVVVEKNLGPEVFETPINHLAFTKVLKYWNSYKKAPAREVLLQEVPGLKVLEPDDEYATGWLVEKLQKRYATNRVQEMVRQAVKTHVDDPIGTMKLLATQATEEAKSVSADRFYTDVAAMLADGLPEQPRPAVLSRTDGVALFYPGEVNLLFGDPEHGKTWVGLAACAETLRKGGRVLVADIDHNGSLAIIANLLLLGVPQEVISDPDRFRHCEPTDVDSVMRVVRDCGDWTPQVVLVDSTGELLPLFDASSDSADDFTRVHNRVLQPLASTGAAVVLVDHLAKGKESRTLGPTGSMAKRRTVGGVSLRVVRDAVFARGRGGSARLWVNKDRHSGVREHCPPPSKDKEYGEQLAGTFHLETDDTGATTWRIAPPPPDQETGVFRPTVLMERASRYIEDNPGKTRNQIAEGVGGRKQSTLLAIDLLKDEEYVNATVEKYPHYTSVKPYREADDPLSEKHLPLRDQLLNHLPETHDEDTPEGQGDD